MILNQLYEFNCDLDMFLNNRFKKIPNTIGRTPSRSKDSFPIPWYCWSVNEKRFNNLIHSLTVYGVAIGIVFMMTLEK